VSSGVFYSTPAVHIYERDGSGSWLAASVLQRSGGSAFGQALDLRDSSLLVGAPSEDTLALGAGEVHVFRFAPVSLAGGAPRPATR
jgi:hypothetical protein